MTSLSTATEPRVRWKKRFSRPRLSTALTGTRVSSSRESRTLLELCCLNMSTLMTNVQKLLNELYSQAQGPIWQDILRLHKLNRM